MADGVFERAKRLLRDPHGTLTRELVRRPGGFGLGQVPERLAPDAATTMVCGYCSTGCGLKVHLREGHAINLSADTKYPVNLGMACPKGWEALAVLDAPDRATTPMIRNERGKLVPVEWPEAIRFFVDRMRAIQAKHGPESVAFLSTGQIPTEEMALLGALAKFGMGMKHGDGNTRQCMATSVVAYKQSFGFDAPPYSYADFEESDVLVFVGANPCIAHPIMWERVCRNPHDPTIVVVDPRHTETAQAASWHVPVRPKGDLAFFYGIANVLFERGWVNDDFVRAHTDGIDAFREHVAAFTPERVEALAGVSTDDVERFARLIHEGKRVSFWWTMGVNQSHQGVKTAQALINLALMTGNIGRPGTGANSITGQCNAMGSRLFSNTTNLLGGHDFGNPEHRAKVAGAFGIDPSRIPTEASWAYDRILEGVLRDEIKGLWIIATNTAHSWINQSDCHAILDKLDFLVVQDMYATTETATRAHLLLPAAGWGEKDGTFINSERRIGLLKKVRRAPGKALADFHIFHLIAEAWGCAEMLAGLDTPEDVFKKLASLSRGQPCDVSGISGYEAIDREGGIQWPRRPDSADDAAQERRLFSDGRFYHPNGRARFVFTDVVPHPESVDKALPFFLLTGRGSSSQWHTQTRTSKSEVLRKLYPNEAYVEVSPVDAHRLGIRSGLWLRVRSKRGSMRARAHVTHTVKPGHVFVPMHYAETNQLTFAAFDPESRQPAYKGCAVSIAVETSDDPPT